MILFRTRATDEEKLGTEVLKEAVRASFDLLDCKGYLDRFYLMDSPTWTKPWSRGGGGLQEEI